MSLDDETIKKLKALAEAATPGPWNHSRFGTQVLTGDSWSTICVFWEKTGDKVKNHHSASWEDGRSSKSIEANAAFIAACSPDVILSLIDALDTQSGRTEAVTDEMINAGLAHYAEGGCSGLDDRERREVVTAIIEAAFPLSTPNPGDADGWRAIETAPRDGTRVDLWCINHLHYAKQGQRVVNVAWGPVRDWMGNERDDWQHGHGEDFQPTHWRPLPAPPASSLRERSQS